ncbi:MAG: hypothetical protein ACI9QN_001255 [Arcticibacterium sp.]|jgi:hypothetical protein
MEESMILAMANSGAYVESGQSPNIDSLQRYLTIWQNEYISTLEVNNSLFKTFKMFPIGQDH